MSPRRTKRSLVDLPNELLFAIVRELDPPSAACLALTCHAHMTMVQAAALNSFKYICPKTAYHSLFASQHLRPFFFTGEQKARHEWNSEALELECHMNMVSPTPQDTEIVLERRHLSYSQTELVDRLLRDGFLVSSSRLKCMSLGHVRTPQPNQSGQSQSTPCVPCYHIDTKQRLKARAAKATITKRAKRAKRFESVRTRKKRTQWYCEDLNQWTVVDSALKVVESRSKARKAS